MATSDFDQWTPANYTAKHIVTNYLLPLPVKLSSDARGNLGKIPENQVLCLETTVNVDQVIARVDDDTTRTTDSGNQVIINIPQLYQGPFKVMMSKETPVRLFGVNDILLKRPRHVKVVEAATNIPRQAMITLKAGDLLDIIGTCKRATSDGVKEFVRCSVKSRTIALNPKWNGVYQTIDSDGIMYSMKEVLERFPLPVAIKPTKLERHSKALVDRLRKLGRSSHLVIISKTSTELILGSDQDYKMALIMAKEIHLNCHIPSWISPTNLEQRHRSVSKVDLELRRDFRLDQLICGTKETILLFEPWKQIFQRAPPKLPVRHRVMSRFLSHPLTTSDVKSGVYPRGRLKRESFNDILYISRPIIPQAAPEPPPRPLDNYISPSEINGPRTLSSPGHSRNMSRSMPFLDILDDEDVSGVYVDITDAANLSWGDNNPTSITVNETRAHVKQINYQASPKNKQELELPDQSLNKSRSMPNLSMHMLSNLDKHGYLRLEDEESLSSDDDYLDYSDGYEKIDEGDLSSTNEITDTRIGDPNSTNSVDDDYLTPMVLINETRKALPSTVQVSRSSGQVSSEKTRKENGQESLSEAESGMFEMEMENDFHKSPSNMPGLKHNSGTGYFENTDGPTTMTTFRLAMRRDNTSYEKVDQEAISFEDRSKPKMEKVAFGLQSDYQTDDIEEAEDYVVILEPSREGAVKSYGRGVVEARREESKDEEDEYYEDVGMILSPTKEGKDINENTDCNWNQTLNAPEPVGDPKLARLPRTEELDGLSVEEVISTLRSLKIPESVQTRFREEQVDGGILKDMCEMDESVMLEQFGMNPFHAMKLRKFVNGWRPNLN